jgi:hypothetical protein
MKLKGDKWANFRKTPLLNVQNVKYKKVPIINEKQIPKDWVQKKPKTQTVYNKKLFNDDKLNAQLDDIVDTGKYGIAETQAFSPYAKERFGMLEPAARWSYDKSKEARDFAYERIKDFLSSEEEV